MDLPDQINVRNLPYSVKRIENLFSFDDEGKRQDAYGYCHEKRLEICLNSGQNIHFERVTLMHECLHAVLFAASIIDHDETVIDSLAYGLVELLQRNPQLVAYFTEDVPCAVPSS